jgi:16S rRNA (guanine527-N7)-methyltransferase
VNDLDLEALVILDARALGAPLDADQRKRVIAFTHLLEKWNRSIRLTGPSDTATLLREQVLEALAFRPFVAHADAWWDIGSGGGLPALVLALLEPERRFVLVEPIAKKVAFLKHAATAFELNGVTVLNGRLEDDGRAPPLPPGAPPRPTAAMSRATFAPERWYQHASRLVGPGGLVLVAAAGRPDLGTHGAAGPEVVAEQAYSLPATGAPRHLMLVRVPTAG